jgi:hypothetical protein
VADEQASKGADSSPRAVRHAVRGDASAAPHGASLWRTTLQWRLMIMAVLFGLWTTGIQARLIYLQVFQHNDMKMRADRQHLRTIVAPAKRGEILDRNGHVLAYSVDADTIFADASEIENAERRTFTCGATRSSSTSPARCPATKRSASRRSS